jgi:site-specific DNA-methyltransferase (adenine-specific)
MSKSTANLRNTIVNGDCINVMATLPAESVDYILTDPPYVACYRNREGQRIQNDDNAQWLVPAFAQMYRTLKSHAFAISFYGWPKVDLFFSAWKQAGFRVGGHIIFRKRYSSKSAFLQYRHEGAYLLVKGEPCFPVKPLPDVMDWVYSGNTFHPTQKSIHILKPLIECFTQSNDLISDPFAGSGSTCWAARLTGRGYLGIQLDQAHHQIAAARLARPLPD